MCPASKSGAGGTVQTTGAGKVLGIEPDYVDRFPGQIRWLLGSRGGVLIAQQTAANLHVTVGDHVVIHRYPAPDVSLAVYRHCRASVRANFYFRPSECRLARRRRRRPTTS